MAKILFFDVETMGLDYKLHGIIQLGVIVEIDGKVVDLKNFFMKPWKGKEIDPTAIEAHGKSPEMISVYPEPKDVHKELIKFLSVHVDQFKKDDKFYPAGYNASFDYQFLSQFFKDAGDKYFGSWFNHRILDPLAILRIANVRGKINVTNFKLETVCKHFNVEIHAHDAMSDIKATQQLYHKVCEFINL